MADQEQLERLQRSAEEWGQWREDHPEIRPDLSFANLNGAFLSGTDLSRADLRGANFSSIVLSNANLSLADLSGANLSSAFLSSTDLNGANLSGAFLREANLRFTNLSGTNLSGTDLSGADLSLANLSSANLGSADLSDAKTGWTIFGDLDLRTVKGLETITHEGPSTIGTDTIMRSQGDIPEAFLRGAGLNDTFIAYVRSLIARPIEYYTCFISYTKKDQAFADRLYADLQSHNVRCWYAPHELQPGDYYRHKIDESIRIYDKVVLILSEHSIESEWVEKEVDTALEREESMDMARQVLFPLRLDDTVMVSRRRWVSSLRYHRHIGDFTHWKEHDAYQHAFEWLLRDLTVTGPPQL
jgi:uncharacterized protein YjbI with pentapeptide repeats